jgi:hypothetical protein
VSCWRWGTPWYGCPNQQDRQVTTSLTLRFQPRRSIRAATCLIWIFTATTHFTHGQDLPPLCEQPVLTLIDAADLLRIDRDLLEGLAEQAEVPARRVGPEWRFSCRALMTWLNGETRSSPLTTSDLADVTATGTTVGQGERALPPGELQDGPIGEAPEARTAEDVFLRGQRVLLGRGEIVLDFGQFYARRDSQQLVSVDGGVGLATVEQEMVTTLLVGRLGILNETEVFASTTLHSLGDAAFLGSTRLASSRRTEVGGIGFGVRHTLLLEGADRPDVIATMDARVPTGDSAYGLGGGLVLVKSVDPVVLFASANYSYMFSRMLSDGMRLGPANRFDVSVGYGLALNDTLAISAAVSGLFAGSTVLDSAISRQPDSFSGSFALTSWLAEGLYIEPSVSFGLSGPGASVAFGVTIPYTF